MASTNVQYISYYTDGSAARKVERKPVYKQAVAPKPVARPRRRVVVKVDPVAVVGIVMAVVVLVSLISGFAQYNTWANKNAQLGQYIQSLQQEQEVLQQEYKAGYDLEQIREIANALGMVPIDTAQTITVDVQLPEMDKSQLSFWDNITIFLAGLFA